MNEPDTPQSAAFFDAFARPVWIVMIVVQMLLGAALFITLVVKYYTFVVGADICAQGGTTLANTMRCTPTTDIMAHFIFALAAFRLAALMFVDQPRAILKAVMIAIAGLFLLFVSSVTIATASWSIAATALTLLMCLVVLYFVQFGFPKARTKD